MFFWMKKKKVVLDCITYSSFAYENTRPDFAYKFFPEWFVKLPKIIQSNDQPLLSLKGCNAFKRLYTANTVIIPASFYIKIEVGTDQEKSYRWEASNLMGNPNSLEGHPPSQMEGFLDFENNQHIKIPLPWIIKSNKEVEFMWADPIWNRKNLFNYCLLPGVIDFRYQHDVLANIIFPYKKEPQVMEINPDHPLVLLAPLTECDIEIKHHVEDLHRIVSYRPPFISMFDAAARGKKYSFSKKIKDAAEKRDAMKRCPFHLR